MKSIDKLINYYMPDSNVGIFCHDLATELFPICRSLTGPGIRETFACLSQHLPDLTVHEVPSGTQVFDWIVPDEWTIRDGYIVDEAGLRIVDFHAHNLHVVGYSEPVDRWLDFDELNMHLYSLPEQPDAIPYVTSYYERRWGFCITHSQRQNLKPGRYRAVIDSDLKPGVLNYAEYVLPGKTSQEVLLSTYVCHPSMANNELSGPVVTTALARWLISLESREYTYRIVFIPETIGSIVYLSQNIEHLKRNVIAGFNITCIGDERCYSFLPSRKGNTLSDQVALHVLKHIDPEFKRYTWLDRGSDERQYCAPGIDLPVATIMRSKYGEYPEYHTSLDDLKLITPIGLDGGFNALRKAIDCIENNVRIKSTVYGEPQLGKRNLYPNLSTKGSGSRVKIMMDMISYCDGDRTLLEIAELIDQPMSKLLKILKPLISSGLIEAFRGDLPVSRIS
jgi:aminopeptidase-like protein